MVRETVYCEPARESVIWNKNRIAVIVELSVMGDTPASTSCNWNRRRFSAVAVAGEWPRYRAKRRTLRM